MPKIVTICGSMRFAHVMMQAARELETKHNCIAIQCVYLPQGERLSDEEIDTLNRLHLQKIAHSDAIYVVNVGGYIGETTRSEIAYACSLNKEILFLEPTQQEVTP